MLKSHFFRGFPDLSRCHVLRPPSAFLVGALDGWERSLLDFRFRFRGSRPVNPAIAVVTIDEESIGRLGRWPWRLRRARRTPGARARR